MLVAFYKTTRPGIAGIYNRIVRWWTRSEYSHCEIIFSDGLSASASFMDKGVRFKEIDYDSTHWDFVEIPNFYESMAREWFDAHKGDRYDVMGNIRFLAGFIPDGRTKWFCSEAILAAIGVEESWRFDPAEAKILLNQIASASAIQAEIQRPVESL